jgi:hypothetical protein
MNSTLHRNLRGGLAFGQPLVCSTSPVDEFDRLAMKPLPHTTPDRGMTFGRPLPCPTDLVDEFDKMSRATRSSWQPMVFHTNLISCVDMCKLEYDLAV